MSGVRDFGIRKSSAVSRNGASPLQAGVRTCGSPRLETAVLASFLAWNWIATGGRASRRTTAESENGERQQSNYQQIFHCVEPSTPVPLP